VADPLLHLPRRLVRERDGEDRGGDDALGDEVRDPPGDHARLARPGGRDDQERAVDVGDGVALRVGQIVEKFGVGYHAPTIAIVRELLKR
jgi:hypothetical protein